jgi:hypothetical protein
MLVRNLKISLLLFLFCSPIVVAQNRKWHPSSYKGLKLGKSTKADVKRTFGKPAWVGHPEDEYDNPVENMIAYEYEKAGGFEGRTAIWMKRHSGVITEIILYPSDTKPLSWQKILNEFGSDYIERESSLGPCPTTKDLHRFKPSQRREYPIFFVYKQKGLYVSVNESNNVQEIVYMERCP